MYQKYIAVIIVSAVVILMAHSWRRYNNVITLDKLKSDNVHMVDDGDVEMSEAIGSAKRMLPILRRAFKIPSIERVSVKVGIHGNGKTDYVWLVNCVDRGIGFSGIMGNDVELIGGYSLGDKICVSDDDVVDWGFMISGKCCGHYTTRVMYTRMDSAAKMEFDSYMKFWPIEESAHQVDSAEASTIAVPPSEPSGSPR